MIDWALISIIDLVMNFVFSAYVIVMHEYT